MGVTSGSHLTSDTRGTAAQAVNASRVRNVSVPDRFETLKPPMWGAGGEEPAKENLSRKPVKEAIAAGTNEKEQRMKLNSTQVKQTMTQLNAQVLPDDHPAVAQLNSVFGEHTFFVDTSGLKVLEPAQTSDMPGQTGEVVSLAEWSDPELTSLRPHEPEPTGVLIALEPSKH
ncbi:hypothetical protein ACVMIH_002118 [Bradyrhizobium sp. USDA 4503]